MVDQDELNNEITEWEKNNHTDLLAEIDRLGIKHYPYSKNPLPLQEALKSTLIEHDAAIDRIKYSFPRSAVFLHKGVSRSHPIANPRLAKEWFNPVVDRNIDSLGDIVANGQGNLIINNIDIH